MTGISPSVTKTTVHTTTLKLDLSTYEIESILKEWAKTLGFSHRVEIDFDVYSGELVQAHLIEITNNTTA